MRRNALAALVFAATFATGCGPTVPYRNVGVGRSDPAVVPAATGGDASEVSVPRFSRDAVPDSVMLREQANAGYNDSPGPPF